MFRQKRSGAVASQSAIREPRDREAGDEGRDRIDHAAAQNETHPEYQEPEQHERADGRDGGRHG